MRHIPIVIGRSQPDDVGSGLNRAVKREWLCGPTHPSKSATITTPCDACYLLHGVLDANVHPWWLQSRPFLAALDLTQGARWFALSLLRSVPTDERESELFSRWVAARTFERLKELVATEPNDRRAIGCHFCGSRPLNREQTLSGSMICPVCASRDVTWPRPLHRHPGGTQP